tara:strand:- start:896 stop:1828 length:933 start_codon:yes stop_codon:yes gene_type:complete
MKFLIIGDLHGAMPQLYVKDFDAIIAPGDFCSDKYNKTINKKWIKYHHSQKDPQKDSENYFLSKVLRIKKSDLKKRENLAIKDGRKVLEFLNSFNKPVYIVPGNHDKSYKKIEEKGWGDSLKRYKGIFKRFSAKETNKKLTKGLKNIKDCQFKLRRLKEFNIIGYGLSNFPEMPTLPSVESKQKLEKIRKAYNNLFKPLKTQYMKRDKSKPTIFLTHNVPYNTKIDRIVDKNSPVNGKHYGSKIAKDFCRRYQPLVCIGGHMHEHFGKDKIGKTVCINAGFGGKVNTLLELKGNKIKTLKFIDKSGQYKK